MLDGSKWVFERGCLLTIAERTAVFLEMRRMSLLVEVEPVRGTRLASAQVPAAASTQSSPRMDKIGFLHLVRQR